MTRCGIVALAGPPNAGKSTLLNALVGEALAAVSAKPQTTRVPVQGLISDATTQIVLVDPAGLMDPAYPLQQAMRRSAAEAIRGADLVVQVHPLPEFPAPALRDLVREAARADAVLLLYTKADLVASERRPALAGALAVSAVSGEGLGALLERIRALLPEGPFLYDPTDAAAQPLRFFAAEFVREALFGALDKELPYSAAVELDAFREAEEPVYIRATIAVERESQKPIVLGKGGRTIKAIGISARRRIEALLRRRVRLELWVTVWPKWRRDPARLAELGLPLSRESSVES
jgi:GTP-binding protein Era